MCDLTNTIKPPIQYIWTDYTDMQTDYWEKIHLILFLLCTKDQYTILSKSPDFFLIEFIFRYEKITLLKWECCNCFKVTLIFSLYSWRVVDASIRGPIYLFNMLSTRSYLFQDTLNIFCKYTIFRKLPPNNIFFVGSREEWICWH